MIQQIDERILASLSSHTRQLGFKRIFQNMVYERCGEFPLIVSRIEKMFPKKLSYLDIGSGSSILPTYILRNSAWDITCIDKFEWAAIQYNYADKVMEGHDYKSRFNVVIEDFLEKDLKEESFDVITNISVIEHFENTLDSIAMERSARLLKPKGLYILTAPFNEGHYKEFFVRQNVYGVRYKDEPVFFQRHYDSKTFENRVIQPSGLHPVEKLYFGDYGFQFKEIFMNIPWPFKPVKMLYQWASPYFAKKYLSYRDYPVSRDNMAMYTASGIFIVLEKK